MKNKLSIIVVLFGTIAAGATFFVIVNGEPVEWIDPNQVGGDKIMPIEMMMGNRAEGGFPEQNSASTTTFTILSTPPGLVWDLNEPNTLGYEWTAPARGTYYARFQANISGPYDGGTEYWTIALRSRRPRYPDLKPWYRIIRAVR